MIFQLILPWLLPTADSTIFACFFQFFLSCVVLPPFFCRTSTKKKKFIENPLERFRRNHKQSKSLILMGHTHTHKRTNTHLYNMSGVYRLKVKYVCEFAKWKWNTFMRRHECDCRAQTMDLFNSVCLCVYACVCVSVCSFCSLSGGRGGGGVRDGKD